MIEKKKIAIVTCAWPPLGGGIGNNAYYQAKELAKMDYPVTVFTPKFRHIIEEEEQSFKVEYLPVQFEFGKAGLLLSLWKKLNDFDIIYLYYPFFGTDLIVWFFKVFHRDKKLILHYAMDPIGTGWQKWFFKFYLNFFLGWLIQESVKVVGLSWDHVENSYLAKYLKKWRNKIVIIPNGIDTNIFYPREKKNDNLKTITFVGGLDKQHFFKGVEVLFQAFNKLDIANKKLLIIGDGAMKADYEQQAKDLGIANQVEFTGWIKNEKLPEYYAQSDVFVLPSTASTECFGIVVAEAQACGVPAVISDWPGVRKTIEDGVTGLLVKPSDVDDLKEKLETILTDEKLKQQMGEQGAERAKKLYAWDKVIIKTDKLYNDV